MEHICGQVHLSLFVLVKLYCWMPSCYINQNNYIMSFIWWWVVFLSDANMSRFVQSLYFRCRSNNQKAGWDVNSQFNPSKLLYLSLVRKDVDFQHHMSWSLFVFNGLRWEIVVHFVNHVSIISIHNVYLCYDV